LREREAREREARDREAREREAKEKERKEREARERERLEKELREKVEKELREKVEREAREREAREREARAKEEARKKEEERIRAEKERQAAREREAKEAKERRERLERLRKEQEERERKKKEEEDKENTRKGTAYAYSSVGEKTSMWPNGRPPAPPSQAASTPPPPKPATPKPATPKPATPKPATPKPASPAPSPTKPAPPQSSTGTEDTYSYRPYDKPKKPAARKKSVSDFSESSWAPSASTAPTSPPQSMRGPYTTTDPNKIVIKAVYGFLNQFSKTPASQLISGVGTVTDGLILRITSAGLFVDDDVRGVAQREWDVKAWTLKLVEVWCPEHALASAASNTPSSVPSNHPFFKTMPATQRRTADRGATKTFTGEEAASYLEQFGRSCGGACRVGLSNSGSTVSGGSNNDKTGEWKGKGLHLFRATIRDQEGKRYLFVIGEEEGWKVAKGLQNLRNGSQVRALGVSGMSSIDARNTLETLGWG